MMELRPFFSFYGSKWRLAGRAYPEPLPGLPVVEPFAGSAGYSLRHHEHGIILAEVDPIVRGIWNFLISARPSEILEIPLDFEGVAELPPGPRKDLVGFWMGRCRSSPARSPSAWCRSGKWPNSFWGAGIRDRIARQVEEVRHWRIPSKDYSDLPDIEATWFIDPPYQAAVGSGYRHSRIDYDHLRSFVESRRGLVIVTESEGADWIEGLSRVPNPHHGKGWKSQGTREAVLCLRQ